MNEERLREEEDSTLLLRAFRLAAGFAAVLWAVKLGETAFSVDLAVYGIYPGRVSGLAGIVFAPLIHGSFSHVFVNTAPVLFLGTALLYGYPRSAWIALTVIYAGTGLGVWLFAREAYHIGASGLTFGMMFFLFTIGVLRWDRRAIAVSLAVFFLYGGMIWGIFPGDPGVSFESHLFGAISGIASAVMLRNRDPAPPEKKYSWEEEAGDGDGEERPPEE